MSEKNLTEFYKCLPSNEYYQIKSNTHRLIPVSGSSWQCKNIFSKMKYIKNTLEGINSRITETEERISELAGRVVEITAMKQCKEKRTKRSKDSLRVFWDNIKSTIIQAELAVKNPPANAGDERDTGSTPGSGRSTGIRTERTHKRREST